VEIIPPSNTAPVFTKKCSKKLLTQGGGTGRHHRCPKRAVGNLRPPPPVVPRNMSVLKAPEAGGTK